VTLEKAHKMPPVLKAWHEVVRTRDARLLDKLIADDAVFHSPLVHTPQEGKSIVIKYLSAAALVLLNKSFSYQREIIGDHEAMLEFQVTVEGIEINGVDHIRWNENDQIVGFKVWVRPLKGIQKVQQSMAALLSPA